MLISGANEAADAEISAILMVHVQDELVESDMHHNGLALVFLSDGRFGLFFWQAYQYDVHGCTTELDAGAAVYIGKTIPALLDLVSTTTGEVCGWKLHGYDTKTLSCYCIPLSPEGFKNSIFGKLPRVEFYDFETFPCPEIRRRLTEEESLAVNKQNCQLANVLQRSWDQLVRASPASAHPPTQLPELTLETVIESVAHADPPARRDPELAALQADLQWAEDVENHIRDGATNDGGAQQAQLSNRVNLISFRSGKGELFRRMLLQDKEFKPLRKSLKKHGYPLVLQPSSTRAA